MEQIHFSVDRCVICGSIVEEGRWVCVGCEKQKVNPPKGGEVRTAQEEAPKKFRRFFRKRPKK